MREFLPLLAQSALFRGIGAEDLLPLLEGMGARAPAFPRGSAVLPAGQKARELGVVLSGQVQVCREDREGNREILARLEPGDLFGEAFACAGALRTVAVWAAADCRVLLLDCPTLLGPAAGSWQGQLSANLMAVLARKNLFLSEKLRHLSRRTLREKLLSYLEQQALSAGKNSFTIPFDRQELADYLCADRSALSREIGKLRREGVLESRGSAFTLLDRDHRT